MHDGYIYTLALCGATTLSTAAPLIVNTMLAAIPPVKRAAWLGEVLPLTANTSPADPLLDEVLADLHDAEVMLIITPLYQRTGSDDTHTSALPARLMRLFDRAGPLAAAGHLRGKTAALVGVETGENSAAAPESALDRIVHKQTVLAPLQRFCLDAGITIAGAAVLAALPDTATDLSPDDGQIVRTLAERAYEQARQQVPHALPPQP
jgi:multimeric flavodoxin WrbA